MASKAAAPSHKRRTGRHRPPLPESLERSSQATLVDAEGWWLVLSDVHIPFHNRKTVELAIKTAREYKAAGVLLNGDILDYHGISRFDRTPDDVRYQAEITAGRQFFEYLRNELPRARIVYKGGNHEERLFLYLVRKAPELFGLDVLTTPALLQLDRHAVEYYEDRRVVKLGKLSVIHGHEYPGASNPVNPARGLFLRAKSTALTSHFHQSSEHHEPTIGGKPMGAWSIGCACQLNPLWHPFSKWNHGYAMVRIYKQGEFSVRNLRVMDGAVV